MRNQNPESILRPQKKSKVPTLYLNEANKVEDIIQITLNSTCIQEPQSKPTHTSQTHTTITFI